jgi:hypothetical protein
MSGPEQKVKITGGCLCGAVRYEILGKLKGAVHCHCSKCRRFHGNFAAYVSMPLDDLKMVERRTLKWFRSVTDETPDVYRGFCSACGSSLFWHPREEDRVAVAAGSLDEPAGVKIMGHVWVSQKGDYYEISDDLPQYAERWEKSEQVK